MSVQKSSRRSKPLPLDQREQLFNAGECGPSNKIQVEKAQIHKLNGIMLDIDPPLLRTSPLLPNVPLDPEEFFERVLSPMLARHPVLDAAEIRRSGTGLHVLIWFDEPVVFENDADRDRWSTIVPIVQSALPSDPLATGITAVTRAIGSKNSKNKAVVKQLKVGKKVSVADVESLYRQMVEAPFNTLFVNVVGADRLSPCPFCSTDSTSFKPLNYVGQCYGCGRKNLEDLAGLLFKPKKPGVKGGRTK